MLDDPTWAAHTPWTLQAGADRIADAVRRILERDSYRDAARRLGESIRRDACSDALTHELEDLPAPTLRF